MKDSPLWMNNWFDQSLEKYHSGMFSRISSQTIQAMPDDRFIDYTSLSDSMNVPSVGVVILNGGLGTSMGCTGPKSMIACSEDGRCFLDIIVSQFHAIPDSKSRLYFLNSFNTSHATHDFLAKEYPLLDWTELMQYPFCRIDEASGLPLSGDKDAYLNPPGHGSIYFDLYHSGELTRCMDDGIEYLFISNADNLAANFDPKIAAYLHQHSIPFLMELTQKTPLDVKGGTIVQLDGGLKLWEVAQVADSDMDIFQQQPYFNTNNIWVHVPSLISAIESSQLTLDLIINRKLLDKTPIVQLEYAMGSAIQSFANAKAMIVPRSRFFPIKRVSDYLLLISDFTTIDASGALHWDTSKHPTIQCHPPFDSIAAFSKHVKVIPSLKDIASLEIGGDLYFDGFVTLKDTVQLMVPDGETIRLDGEHE